MLSRSDDGGRLAGQADFGGGPGRDGREKLQAAVVRFPFDLHRAARALMRSGR
jgi:hypothetical protein